MTAEAVNWNVLLLNDDSTPMAFVVEVIERFFEMDRESATRLMLRIHYEGTGACGAYLQETAKAKADQLNDFARKQGHPLQCVVQRKP
jgi:ATP-dependent Clp protease adaptor protein ClpS